MTVKQRAQEVLIAHQKRDIKGCICGKWGSDTGQMGRCHTEHVIAELERAGLVLVEKGATQ